MKAAFTLLFLSVATFSLATTKSSEQKIVLKAGSQGLFYVIVESTPNNDLQIKYMLKDSVSKSINNDEFYKSTIERFLNANLKFEDQVTLMEKMDSISQRHTYYTTDSITVNPGKDAEYLQLFNTFLSSSAESTEQDKKSVRIVLDGLPMVFTLSEGNLSRKVYATSPSQDSNPLMYKFISETMKLYRENKPEGILSKGRTRGY